MLSDEHTRQIVTATFDKLWKNLRVERHIVVALSKKKRNSKQASETALQFQKETRIEIIEELVAWYRLKKHFESEENDTLLYDILDRVNAELARIGVPFLPSDQK